MPTETRVTADQMIAKIQEEVARRRLGGQPEAPEALAAPAPGHAAAPVDSAPPPIPPAFQLQPAFAPDPTGRYRLQDLTAFHDTVFVMNAYRAVLERLPDPEGMRHHTELLRSGVSKAEIIGRIRFSREGRNKGTVIRGLVPRFALQLLFRVPLLGPLAEWGVGLLSVGRLTRQSRRFEAYSMHVAENLASQVRGPAAALDDLAGRIDAVGARVGAQESQVHALRGTVEDRLAPLPERLQGVELRLAEVDTQRSRLEAAVQDLPELRAGLSREGHARRGLLARVETAGRVLDEALASLQQLDERFEVERTAREALASQIAHYAEALQTVGSRIDAGSETQNRLARDLLERGGALQRLEADLSAGMQQVEGVGQQLAERSEQLAGLRQGLDAQVHAREALAGQVEAEADRRSVLEERFDRAERALDAIRLQTGAQDRRLGMLLEEARRRLPEPMDEAALRSIAGEGERRLDALYLAFENLFRGSPEDVKQRLSIYLPYIEKAGIGEDDHPLLDLGCGRGEWLELLAEKGWTGVGVDSNREVVRSCRERDLSVVEGDLLPHLRSLPDGGLAAVTAFHVVEHLGLDDFVCLLDESIRALRSGGVAIFETPNPANLQVGSHTFHLDPTHRRPVPAELLSFLVEARGLCRVEVLELNPYPRSAQLDGSDPVARRLNEQLYGPRDYAVIGHKP